MGGTVSKATEKAAKKAEFNATAVRWDADPSVLAAESRLFSWMSYPESEWEGEWRTMGEESEAPQLGAHAMEFNVVANRDPLADHKTAYHHMATKGIPLKVKIDGRPTRFELMNKDGRPEWAWQLHSGVSGIDPKLLDGKPVCATVRRSSGPLGGRVRPPTRCALSAHAPSLRRLDEPSRTRW